MKLLLIEDNRPLAESIKKYLSKTFVVVAKRDGEEGLQTALSSNFDVIVLDLGLPTKNGYEICKAIRMENVHTPIIVLTGNDDVPTRVALLNIGADDYVTKPFHMAELKARLGALLRRVSEEPQYHDGQLRVSDLIVDSERRCAERQGVHIPLRRKEFDILECLVRNAGRPVTRSMLLDYAWDGTKESWNNTVDVHIKHLRDKIDRPFNSRLIRTAYGIGYVIDDM